MTKSTIIINSIYFMFFTVKSIPKLIYLLNFRNRAYSYHRISNKYNLNALILNIIHMAFVYVTNIKYNQARIFPLTELVPLPN